MIVNSPNEPCSSSVNMFRTSSVSFEPVLHQQMATRHAHDLLSQRPDYRPRDVRHHECAASLAEVEEDTE